MTSKPFLPAPLRGPKWGDLVSVGDEKFPIEALPLCQPSAPALYDVEAPRDVPRLVRWNGEEWIADAPASTEPTVELEAEPAVEPVVETPKLDLQAIQAKPPVVRKPRQPRAPRKDTVAINSISRPPKPIGAAAVAAIQLSTEVLSLHEQLDQARERHGQDGDPQAPTWEEYERCILAVDQADPGFYLGRVLPLAPTPRYVMPDLDYDGIRSRMTFREIVETPEPEEEMAPVLFTEGTCRLCGCTDYDCSECIKKTGMACHWVEPDLCSACAPK